MFKLIWCALFHKKYRERVGEPWRKVGSEIDTYKVECKKCGVRDVELVER